MRLTSQQNRSSVAPPLHPPIPLTLHVHCGFRLLPPRRQEPARDGTHAFAFAAVRSFPRLVVAYFSFLPIPLPSLQVVTGVYIFAAFYGPGAGALPLLTCEDELDRANPPFFSQVPFRSRTPPRSSRFKLGRSEWVLPYVHNYPQEKQLG